MSKGLHLIHVPLFWVQVTVWLYAAVVIVLIDNFMAPEYVFCLHKALTLIQDDVLIKNCIVPPARWVGAHGEGAAESALMAPSFVTAYATLKKSTSVATIFGKSFFF